MNAIYVDDERSAHVNFYYDMKDRPEIQTLTCFFKAGEALDHARSHIVDCAFLDVELGGGENGLDLADQLRKIYPNVEVVFVTAYDHYARDAYRLGGRAYLSKPYDQQELGETVALLMRLTKAHRKEAEQGKEFKDRVEIKTFGNFDLLVDGRPVAFKNAKAKELLAFLVQQRGGTVNGPQVLMALWEHLEYSGITSTYVRRTVRALREELERLEVGDIFVYKRNCYSIDPALVHCDYYDLMAGVEKAKSQYNGEYMSQYSWGESIIPLIERKVGAMGA
ncbi:response regulator [Bengtsoniella intestinalis]|uniref:response regulator n=1 Tax=Bengtsoniella intestinalis TaxID=3073143 RepID=UPI00391F1557